MEDPQDLVPERKINTTEEETAWLRVREDAAARLRAATVFSRDVRCSHVGFSRVSSLFTRKRNWPNPSELTRGKVVEKTWCQDKLDPGISRDVCTMTSVHFCGTFQAPDFLFLFFLKVLAMCGIYYIHEIPQLLGDTPRNNQNPEKGSFFKTGALKYHPVCKRLKCFCAPKPCTDNFLPEALRPAEVAAARVVWLFFSCGCSICSVRSQRQMPRRRALTDAAVP